MTAPLTPKIPPQEDLAEQLHIWYLEVTALLNPNASNKQAQKPYKELSGEQQAIDKYIAEKVQAHFNQQVNQAREETAEAIYEWRVNGKVNSVPYARSVIRADAVKDLIKSLQSSNQEGEKVE